MSVHDTSTRVPPVALLSTGEVCERTGATYRQVDYWARTGVLSPSVRPAVGSGNRRVYSTPDVRVAAVLVQLAQLGCSGDTLRHAAGELHRFTATSAALTLHVSPWGHVTRTAPDEVCGYRVTLPAED